jgi:hypothetical protein
MAPTLVLKRFPDPVANNLGNDVAFGRVKEFGLEPFRCCVLDVGREKLVYENLAVVAALSES